MSNTEATSNTWLFLAAVAFMFVGLAYSPLFFACSIFLFASAEATRNKTLGIVGAGLGLLFLLLVLGYGFGKDLALGDNSQASVSHSGHAAQQVIQADVAPHT